MKFKLLFQSHGLSERIKFVCTDKSLFVELSACSHSVSVCDVRCKCFVYCRSVVVVVVMMVLLFNDIYFAVDGVAYRMRTTTATTYLKCSHAINFSLHKDVVKAM